MQRQLVLSKFRNLGFDKDDYLIINNSLEKGKMGDVVTIIGQNNAGKSNVLDALCKFPNGEINKRDITDLSYEEEYRKPSLRLEIKDKDLYVKVTIDLKERGVISYDIKELKTNVTIDQMKAFINRMYAVSAGVGARDSYIDTLINEANNAEEKNADYLFERIKATYVKLSNNGKMNLILNYAPDLRNSAVYKAITEQNKNIAAYLEKRYGYNPIPTVYRYEENNISSKDLRIESFEQVEGHKFFEPLLKRLKIQVSTLRAAYDEYVKSNNNQVFKKINKQLAKKMEEVNDVFNDLYFAGNDKYLLSLECSPNGLAFGMGRGKSEDPINIDYQSVGFKWFFNLFFSFILNTKIEAGGIVIMDEPAHNLHPEGQRELHSFLKEFAKANDITFVIATHSPFIIDVDYLDELRVVSMVDNKSKIDNLFSAVNDDDPDSLLPIKEALTIKQNVFYDLDTTVVWVEGITDYNYLTLFKKLFGKKNLAFLPFNGVGNTKEKTHQILSKILKIKFHRCEMLVDGDKAGKDMIKQCEETDFKDRVFSVSDLNEGDRKYISIEDLFSKNDKANHPGLDYKNDLEYKKAYLSSCMKRNCSLEDFDKETINNFKRLFELLEE